MSKINEKPLIVGICGGSASGKTSVANILHKNIGYGNCLLFSMDNYYKGPNDEERKRIEEYNFDCPYALDLDLLFKHLQQLSNNQAIDMPIYCFNGSYRKKETNRVEPKKIIIFEGILAFHDKRIRDLLNFKIFVNLDPDLRLARRIERDIADRGRILETVIQRYHKFVKPAFENYIKPTKKYADYVIPRGAENSLATDVISQFLCELIFKKCGKKSEYLKKSFINFEFKYIFNSSNLHKDIKAEKGYIKNVFDEKQLNSLKTILSNYINEKKTIFSKFYLEVLNKNILNYINCISIKDNRNIIYESDLKNNSFEYSENKCNILYYPILLNINKELIDLIQANNKQIIISSIFMTEDIHFNLYEKNNKLQFISLFYGNIFNEYKDYITKGGLLTEYSSGLPEDLYSLNSLNFEENFKKLVRTSNFK